MNSAGFLPLVGSQQITGDQSVRIGRNNSPFRPIANERLSRRSVPYSRNVTPPTPIDISTEDSTTQIYQSTLGIVTLQSQQIAALQKKNVDLIATIQNQAEEFNQRFQQIFNFLGEADRKLIFEREENERLATRCAELESRLGETERRHRNFEEQNRQMLMMILEQLTGKDASTQVLDSIATASPSQPFLSPSYFLRGDLPAGSPH